MERKVEREVEKVRVIAAKGGAHITAVVFETLVLPPHCLPDPHALHCSGSQLVLVASGWIARRYQDRRARRRELLEAQFGESPDFFVRDL